MVGAKFQANINVSKNLAIKHTVYKKKQIADWIRCSHTIKVNLMDSVEIAKKDHKSSSKNLIPLISNIFTNQHANQTHRLLQKVN